MADDLYTSTIDQAITVRDRLAEDTRTELLIGDYPDLLELLFELNDYGRTAGPDLAKALGTNISVLNRFFKQKPVDMRTVRAVADRIVTHLRSETRHAILDGGYTQQVLRAYLKENEKPLVVTAVEWKVVVRTPELQEQITELIRLIGEVTRHATTANLPPGERALTEIERAQLIAVLQTALNILKSPMVETGLLKKASGMAKRAAEKVAEKQVEIAFGAGATALSAALLELLKHL